MRIRIILELEEDDLDSAPMALGYAIGCMLRDGEERKEKRMIRRLEGLFEALKRAEVYKDSPPLLTQNDTWEENAT
jgi:hypothetical protein